MMIIICSEKKDNVMLCIFVVDSVPYPQSTFIHSSAKFQCINKKDIALLSLFVTWHSPIYWDYYRFSYILSQWIKYILMLSKYFTRNILISSMHTFLISSHLKSANKVYAKIDIQKSGLTWHAINSQAAESIRQPAYVRLCFVRSP